ncbi:MAG: response regulator protein with domain [Gammaproteobacteria bacterium]|jgi:diguanylate cyclase (GGDEF)-like protein|nr:response regulator protein with domain [Gammaproteobacteria bacterium]
MDESLINRYSLEKTELQDFSRTIAEIHFLLISVVVLYIVAPGTLYKPELVFATIFYTFFVIGFHYIGLQKIYTPWKLASESWIMILFITGILWATGKVDSPLVNLYLLAIVISALTLGKTTTLLQVGLISSSYLYLSYLDLTYQIFTGNFGSYLVAKLFPFWLVAYLTTSLAADIQAAKNKIRILAERDELTALMNMRAFKIMFGRYFIQAKRYQHEFALLMIDSDNLKTINDQYGHAAGDALIRHMAKIITSSLRVSDSAARYGGDEFIILLANTGKEQAFTVAERIRSKLATSSFKINENDIFTTASIGVASFPSNDEEPQALLKKADEALYQSKITGKNKVSAYLKTNE